MIATVVLFGCTESEVPPLDVSDATLQDADVSGQDLPEGDHPLISDGVPVEDLPGSDVPGSDVPGQDAGPDDTPKDDLPPNPDVDEDTGPPGILDPENSSLDYEGPPTPADGLTPAVIVVQIVDTAGQPMSGVSVQLGAAGAKGVIVTQPPPTDGEGYTWGSVVAINGGSHEIQATVGTDGTALSQAVIIPFTGCTSTADHYRRNLRGPVFQTCMGCHNAFGLAAEWGAWTIDGRLHDAEVANTLETFTYLATTTQWVDGLGDVPLLLAKPTELVIHEGGEVLTESHPAYGHLVALVERLQDGDDTCAEVGPSSFEGVELLSEKATLNKAAFALVGRSPTDSELGDLAEKTAGEVIDQSILQDPKLRGRVKTLFNDLLLTDRILGSFKLLTHLSSGDFPRRFTYRVLQNKPQYTNPKYTCKKPEPGLPAEEVWEEVCCVDTPDVNTLCQDGPSTVTFCDLGDKYANYGVRQQGLELIAHVVANDLPFSEILTADYTMVNPLLARIFKLPNSPANDISFDDDCDIDDWKPLKLTMDNLQGVDENNASPSGLIAHAGVLSTHTFLNRYTSTPTNLNRHRASRVYKKFLDVDIESLVSFTVGQDDEPEENPTMTGFSCRVCHAVMDPVAGAFIKWTGLGRFRRGRLWEACASYLPDEGCVVDGECGDGFCVDGVCVSAYYDPALCVRPIGFGGEALDMEAFGNAPLRMVAEKIANHPRFPRAIVKHLLSALTGRDPMEAPTERWQFDYAHKVRAFLAEEAEIERIADLFVAGGLNLKVALREIVLGPHFRAVNANAEAIDQGQFLAAQLGGGRMLTPEELNDRIKDGLGLPWILPTGRVDALLKAGDGFMMLYGGIDSGSIVDRTRDPFAVASAVVTRMSNEMGCLVVPQDMAWIDPDKRRFFGDITPQTVPLDEDGQKVNETEINATIELLHATLLHESAPPGSVAFQETYDLLEKVWKDGLDRVKANDEPSALSQPCRAKKDVTNGQLFADDPERADVTSDPKYVIRSWIAVMTYLLRDSRFTMSQGGNDAPP